MEFKIILLLAIIWELPNSLICTKVEDGNINYNFTYTEEGIMFFVYNGTYLLNFGVLYNGHDASKIVCEEPGNCRIGDTSFSYQTSKEGILIQWETYNLSKTLGDCFRLLPGNWYGGPERTVQVYPLETMTIDGNDPYVLRKTDNLGVAERYWLNSQGFYIFVDENIPLFVEQNQNNSGMVCFNARTTGPYINRKRNILAYRIIFKENVKIAHLNAVKNYLGKPKGHPRHAMVSEPIWTTWAKYKRDINDEIVISFAEEIRKQGYKNGQIEIDDAWETCYGSQEFSKDKFPNIKNTVAKLKEMNFRVTLWVHPFVNRGCQNNSNEGLEKGYFVKDVGGNTNASWWNGMDAMMIDFTNPDAAKWYTNRLKKLQEETGIDSFKFDAGETDYLHQTAVYNHVDDIEFVPNEWSDSYIRTVAKFGDLVEVRSAYRTQDLPIFVRMLDKDSNWSENNGLYTLITTLLMLNINGYTMVLPDMIGGNGYSDLPDAELLVRWTQANTFMPAMQFSYLPWEITSDEFDAAAIVKKFVDLHAKHSSDILHALQMSVKNSWPVNPPVWWVDPTDPVALRCDDQYLLGDSILVAPVIKKGARTRDVFLPKGKWIDGNNGTVYKGGHIFYDYPAPIDVLPYFIKHK